MNRWEGLDEFVAVAECGSFMRAAERLRVSSSHVSRQIARLEERLQARLLYRTTRRVSLTEPVIPFRALPALDRRARRCLSRHQRPAQCPHRTAAHDRRGGLWRALHRAAGE